MWNLKLRVLLLDLVFIFVDAIERVFSLSGTQYQVAPRHFRLTLRAPYETRCIVFLYRKHSSTGVERSVRARDGIFLLYVPKK